MPQIYENFIHLLNRSNLLLLQRMGGGKLTDADIQHDWDLQIFNDNDKI